MKKSLSALLGLILKPLRSKDYIAPNISGRGIRQDVWFRYNTGGTVALCGLIMVSLLMALIFSNDHLDDLRQETSIKQCKINSIQSLKKQLQEYKNTCQNQPEFYQTFKKSQFEKPLKAESFYSFCHDIKKSIYMGEIKIEEGQQKILDKKTSTVMMNLKISLKSPRDSDFFYFLAKVIYNSPGIVVVKGFSIERSGDGGQKDYASNGTLPTDSLSNMFNGTINLEWYHISDKL